MHISKYTLCFISGSCVGGGGIGEPQFMRYSTNLGDRGDNPPSHSLKSDGHRYFVMFVVHRHNVLEFEGDISFLWPLTQTWEKNKLLRGIYIVCFSYKSTSSIVWVSQKSAGCTQRCPPVMQRWYPLMCWLVNMVSDSTGSLLLTLEVNWVSARLCSS